MTSDQSCTMHQDTGPDNLSLNTNSSDSNISSVCTMNASNIPVMPLYITVTATLFYVIIFLTGTVGNIIVAAVVGLHRDMRSSTNLFLVNLALADFMVITACMPTALVDMYANDVWYFGSVMCTMVPLLEHCAAHASVLTMFVIATERFQAICHPLKIRDTKIYSRQMKLITVLSIWIVALVFSLPFIWISDYHDSKYHDGTPIQVCRQSVRLGWQKAYFVSLLVIFFGLPFVVITFLYAVIAKTLAKDFHGDSKGESHTCSTKTKARKKVIMMLIIITIFFFVFHLPFRTVSLWITFTDNASIKRLGFEGYWNLLCFARIMFYLNSCTNPVVYNLVSTKFRQAFICLLLGRRRGVNRENTYTTQISLKQWKGETYA